MNRADREELVDQMIDADKRAHPGDLPPIRPSQQPTPWDRMDDLANTEFRRCSGDLKPDTSQGYAATWIAQELVSVEDRRKREDRRDYVAMVNSPFTLRRVTICREWGGCGPDLPASVQVPPPSFEAEQAQRDGESIIPHTPETSNPFVLSLACGMGLREKQGLPTYANEARFRAEERAGAADRARRCAQGDTRACP